MNAFDWSHWDNVLSVVVSGTAIAGIVWAAIKFLWNPLFEWLTRRRAQARLLDQLACGSSVEYVESLFGPAQFITYADSRQQRTYHLRGAWVMIEIEDSRVIAFSVTITDRRMWYSTKTLTLGFIKVKLGRDTFSSQEEHCDGEQFWMAAYRAGYARAYYIGRFGAYLRFIVSHNLSGTGNFNTYESAASGDINSGAFDQVSEPFILRVDASGITANTLTVIHPEASSLQFLSRNIHGPDESHVKMATAIKPSKRQILRGKLAYRRFQLTQAEKKWWQ
ncbi:ETEC_3214 domain-containing protein [Mycolicibacterium septicum]|uniref:ETEC_3214 domain-containing protein n=1 Tax=Mycolicibacterium septicum TaxID=98668 RepID=A0ABW9M0D4_9MYCO